MECAWGHLPWSFLHCGCLLWSKFLFEMVISVPQYSIGSTCSFAFSTENKDLIPETASINKRYLLCSNSSPSPSPFLIPSLCEPCPTRSALLASSEISQFFPLCCEDDKSQSFGTREIQSVYVCVKISAEIPGPDHVLCRKNLLKSELQEIID